MMGVPAVYKRHLDNICSEIDADYLLLNVKDRGFYEHTGSRLETLLFAPDGKNISEPFKSKLLKTFP